MKLIRAFIVVAAMLVGVHANAAITLNGSVQVCDKSGSTCVLAHTGANAGESVIVGCSWRSTGTPEAITGATVANTTGGGDSQALSGTTLQTVAAVQHRNQFWTLNSLTSSADKTITVTWDTSNVFGSCFSAVIAGADTAGVVSDDQAATGNDAAPTVPVTAGTDDAVFMVASSAAGSPTAGSGFTLVEMMDFWSYAASQYDLDADGAPSEAVMAAASGQWGAVAIVVPIDGGGGGGGSAVTIISQVNP